MASEAAAGLCGWPLRWMRSQMQALDDRPQSAFHVQRLHCTNAATTGRYCLALLGQLLPTLLGTALYHADCLTNSAAQSVVPHKSIEMLLH
jgi:hypothetical protein